MLGLQDAVVDGGQYKPVSQHAALLLHQVQRQRGASGAVAVQEAHIGVQPHGGQRRRAVTRQQDIRKRQHGIDRVARGPARAAVKAEGFAPLQDQLIHHAKVL